MVGFCQKKNLIWKSWQKFPIFSEILTQAILLNIYVQVIGDFSIQYFETNTCKLEEVDLQIHNHLGRSVLLYANVLRKAYHRWRYFLHM